MLTKKLINDKFIQCGKLLKMLNQNLKNTKA